MSHMKYLHKVNYRRLLDENAPISSYDLYQGESHKFAFLHFYNNSLNMIRSFKVKFDFYDENKNLISSDYEKIVPEDFISHSKYNLKNPLVMPLNAEGFNYYVFDVDFVSKKEIQTQRIKLQYLPSECEGKFVKPVHGSRKFALFVSLASILLAGIGSVAFLIRGAVIGQIGNSGSNSYQNPFHEGDIVTENGISYQYESGSFNIVSYSGIDDYIMIPRDFNGYPVARINSNAFESVTLLQVDFQNDNLKIESYAFGNCNNLESIYGSVGFIENYAFAKCGNLTSVKLERCYEINAYAFDGCYKLKNVFVNKDCKIDERAFPDTVVVNRI